MVTRTAGRSSVWLERYLGVVEAASSSLVAPTKFSDFFLNEKSLRIFYFFCGKVELHQALAVSIFYIMFLKHHLFGWRFFVC